MFKRMILKLRNPLIHPSWQYPSDDFLKKPRFCRKYQHLELQKGRLFLGSGAAERRSYILNLGKGGLFRSFTLGRIASFSSTRKVLCSARPLSERDYGSGISRAARMDAQKALFDYLNDTRNLPSADAEYMSKNSPVFLEKLIAKFENEQDVGQLITKSLRYHPINEFEPFFESLGLKQVELHSLLPRNLLYLSDDDVLVENYHVLCNFGVPQSKMGKMYKEATEIFRYGYGVLSLKLQAYAKLGLSYPTIIKLVTCCPSLLVGHIDPEFLRVIERLEAVGVHMDDIIGCFSETGVYNWSQIHGMLEFMESMGCDKTNLRSLIREHPRFIFHDSGKKIYMLVATLLKLGLKMDKVLFLFVQYPRILVGNCTKNLCTSVNFLFESGMEPEDIAAIVSTHTQVLGSCTPKNIRSVMKDLNLTTERLCEILKEDPSQITNLLAKGNMTLNNTPKIEGLFLREKTNFLVKIGFAEDSDEMTKALRKFRGRGDQLQERFDSLVTAGLDFHTATKMVKSVPPLLNQSKDVIEKKIDYLINHMGYPLESLAAFPSYLCYNMEKIRLRFTMYKWSMDHEIILPSNRWKMVKSPVALSTLLACADARFEKYFVCLNPEGQGVWETLKSQHLQAKEN